MDLILNEVPSQFKLDTGAAVSILNQVTYEKVLRNSAKVKLKSYSGEAI